MNFKSTYPANWKPVKERVTDDSYSRLNTNLEVKDIKPGQVVIGKTVDPIGLIDIYAEKPEVITEYRKPSKMPTLGEMKAFWTNFNKQLYDSVIAVKYTHA